MTIKSSPAAVNLIVMFEVSSQAAYTTRYQHPTWPGGASGVTIGIGYDCGYATATQIRSDWTGKIPDAMVEILARTAGIHGSPASSETHMVRDQVVIPWDAAMAVFIGHDMPKWEGMVTRALSNTDLLSGDSFGALVSLAYNRGVSFTAQGDRYNEMRAIHAHMAMKNFADIPNDFRSMKRLWPGVPGLRIRRDQEADLFAKGLGITAPSTPAAPATSISWVQNSLNLLGEQPPLIVDGIRGHSTTQAVKNFQTAYRLQPDGVVGPQTVAKITELLASQKGN